MNIVSKVGNKQTLVASPTIQKVVAVPATVEERLTALETAMPQRVQERVALQQRTIALETGVTTLTKKHDNLLIRLRKKLAYL
jgi:hypothetical protein